MIAAITTALAWLNFDYRRWLIPIAALAAIVLALWAAYAAFWSFVGAHADAAVDKARADWIEDARQAERAADERAQAVLSKADATNNQTRKDLKDAAQKGDGSPVGRGVDAVLDRLQRPAATSR